MLAYVGHAVLVAMFAALGLLAGCGADPSATGAQAGERAAEARATADALIDIPAPDATPAPSTSPASPAAQPQPSAAAQAAPSAQQPQTAQPAPAADLADVTVELQPVAGDLDSPVGLANAADGSGRMFVVNKRGWITIVADGQLRETPFLDIRELVQSSGSEQGLLGLAFHPRYRENGRFFIAYTNTDGNQVVARYQVSGEPDRADPASAVELLVMEDPAPNHNGGGLAFGPDGYLYIGTGDGGGAGDRYGNGQNFETLLGKMLRLDVDGGEPYAIPADNPFREAEGARPEIWATGLRNPWRFSFDRATGDLLIADVGQNVYEEVNLHRAGQPGGANFGWPITEASHCFPERNRCSTENLTLPIGEYSHDEGCSVTGGYVYRGATEPSLSGAYIFADYCSGLIFGLAQGEDGAWTRHRLAETDLRITSFGEDEAGEIYMVALNDSTLYRITTNN